MMKQTWLVTALVGPLALALVVGCGGPGGPAASPTAAVSCTVTVNGSPLDQGSIQFMPDKDKGTEGRSANGVIKNGKVDKLTTYPDEDGDGAIIGSHKVEITSMSAGEGAGESPVPGEITVRGSVQRIPPMYNSQTTLTANVTKEGPNNFTFDLTIANFK